MAKAKVEKPKKEEKEIVVEVITPKPIEVSKDKIISERVSGSHKVKFKPNGNNPRLGYEVKKMAATTAQLFVDSGFGNIVE